MDTLSKFTHHSEITYHMEVISGNTSVMSKRNDRLTLISLLDSTGFLCEVVVAGVVIFVVLSPT